MSFLYLVVMVAANTKYSINSLLSPAPDVTFWKIKIAHKAPSWRSTFMDATP
ncbi:hypothetical protein SAMN05216228_10409 [Rhizobium tibeticum]|uniref:Uncharacterized protein n=1 Tax=Rhizobium tibeticum TaxID=501024 RepID=A0A1H8V803_9HYPH|nr:hypothetical protein RTCCBAU85039_5944 [Rhizobium tibeticum]SEP11590.1 hypothetical protein SAMN05216228_10409 [Rhizobium tibeticum]